jgi:hypothetical protein
MVAFAMRGALEMAMQWDKNSLALLIHASGLRLL